MSTYSFTGNKVSFTYQRLLQISDGGDGNPTGIIYDGYGATVTIADENINNLYTTVNNLIANGLAGSTGATGPQGWQGPIGLTGESVTGAQGAYGPTGFQGNTGAGFTTIYNASPTRILTASGSNSANAESNLTFDGSVLSLHNQQIQSVGSIDFSTNLPNPSPTSSRLFYDYTEESLSYYSGNLQSPIHIGRELSLRVYNVSGTTISVGQSVHVNGATGGLPSVVVII